MDNIVFVNWRELLKLTYNIAFKVINSGYKPETIVGISRWGLIPALLLSDALNVDEVSSIRIQHWSKGLAGSTIKVQEPVEVNVKNRKVLVIDEVADTGLTLKVATETLRSLKADEVRSAVLYLKPRSIFKPDYYGILMETNAWIIYPWSIFEELSDVLNACNDNSNIKTFISKVELEDLLNSQQISEFLKIRCKKNL
ncbi:MAG: phosphoribosyltransferase [Thermoprotei archaeon]|jgi:hypoxanthine phosphoribosyltransferase